MEFEREEEVFFFFGLRWWCRVLKRSFLLCCSRPRSDCVYVRVLLLRLLGFGRSVWSIERGVLFGWVGELETRARIDDDVLSETLQWRRSNY